MATQGDEGASRGLHQNGRRLHQNGRRLHQNGRGLHQIIRDPPRKIPLTSTSCFLVKSSARKTASRACARAREAAADRRQLPSGLAGRGNTGTTSPFHQSQVRDIFRGALRMHDLTTTSPALGQGHFSRCYKCRDGEEARFSAPSAAHRASQGCPSQPVPAPHPG
jgi:hypothetical protein